MFLIIYMAFMASMSGGSFPGSQCLNKRGAVDEHGNDKGGKLPFNGTWIPELLFALPFGGCASLFYTDIIAVLIALAAGTAWSYFFMQRGHGVVLPWGDEAKPGNRTRSQTLDKISDPLAKLFRIKKWKPDGYSRTVEYCRLFMAVKGFLIGLPTGPGAIVLTVLWPLSYEIGHRLRGYPVTVGRKRIDPHTFTELLSGVGAAIAILMVINGVSHDVFN